MKIGIIGCGLIGKKRAACPDFELVAAADACPEKADAICSCHGGKPSCDRRDVLESDAEIIIIAVTHDQLAPLALEALRAGKHVLVEKPGARNAAELEPVANLARELNLKVKVGFNHRFHPAVQKAMKLVAEGELGELMFIHGRYGHGGRIGYEREWRFQPEISGGGELLDQGSHLIDLSRWFLGEFSSCHGILRRYFWPGKVEDNCFMTLCTEKGQCAQLHASWTEWKNSFFFEVSGRNGKVSIRGLGGSYGTEELTFCKMLPEMGPPQTTIWQYPFKDESWRNEMDELARAIREDAPVLGDAADAMRTLQVVDAIYAEARQ